MVKGDLRIKSQRCLALRSDLYLERIIYGIREMIRPVLEFIHKFICLNCISQYLFECGPRELGSDRTCNAFT